MNVLDCPPVPALSDFRLSTRQKHLVREIEGRRRNRRIGSLALGGSAVVASGVTSVLLVVAGPGTTNAFAAWTAAPTTPAPNQVSSAEATCESAAATPPPDKTAGLAAATQVSLVDTRGPFTLVLFEANASPTLLCVSGPSVGAGAQSNSQMRLIGSPAVRPGTGQIAVNRLVSESANDGQAYTIAEGSVGPGVMAATLALSNGSDVVATTGNGFFLAWWPGSAAITSATVTTATGTTTQPISSATPNSDGSGNTVKRTIDIGH